MINLCTLETGGGGRGGTHSKQAVFRDNLRVVAWSVLGVLLRRIEDCAQAHGILVLLLEAHKSLVEIIDELRRLSTESQMMQTRVVLVVRHVGSRRNADTYEDQKKERFGKVSGRMGG